MSDSQKSVSDAVVSQPLVERLRNSTKIIPPSQPEGTQFREAVSAAIYHYGHDLEALKRGLRDALKIPASTTPVVSGQAWIPVEQRLPESWALIVIDGIVQHLAARYTPDGWEWCDDEADTAPVNVVTHWQPIPAPPSLPKARETDWVHITQDSEAGIEYPKSAAPPLLPAQDNLNTFAVGNDKTSPQPTTDKGDCDGS